MNIIENLNLFASVGLSAVAIISGLIGFVITILWLVIGWRAMRAHERIAESVSLQAYKSKASVVPNKSNEQKKSDEEQMKRYQTFLNEVEGVKELSFVERQTIFKAWLAEKEKA